MKVSTAESATARYSNTANEIAAHSGRPETLSEFHPEDAALGSFACGPGTTLGVLLIGDGVLDEDGSGFCAAAEGLVSGFPHAVQKIAPSVAFSWPQAEHRMRFPCLSRKDTLPASQTQYFHLNETIRRPMLKEATSKTVGSSCPAPSANLAESRFVRPFPLGFKFDHIEATYAPGYR
jgi:hypothetical protein